MKGDNLDRETIKGLQNFIVSKEEIREIKENHARINTNVSILEQKVNNLEKTSQTIEERLNNIENLLTIQKEEIVKWTTVCQTRTKQSEKILNIVTPAIFSLIVGILVAVMTYNLK